MGLRLLRRDQDRRGGHSAEHPAGEQGLRVPAERLPGPGAGGACRPGGPHPVHSRPAAAPGAGRRGGRQGGRGIVLRHAAGALLGDARAGRYPQGRHGLLALQLGDHRVSQGGDPPAPRHARGRRPLRPGDDRAGRVGRLVLGGQAVLRLRAGQRSLFPPANRRHDGALARTAPAREGLRDHRPLSAHGLL